MGSYNRLNGVMANCNIIGSRDTLGSNIAGSLNASMNSYIGNFMSANIGGEWNRNLAKYGVISGGHHLRLSVADSNKTLVGQLKINNIPSMPSYTKVMVADNNGDVGYSTVNKITRRNLSGSSTYDALIALSERNLRNDTLDTLFKIPLSRAIATFGGGAGGSFSYTIIVRDSISACKDSVQTQTETVNYSLTHIRLAGVETYQGIFTSGGTALSVLPLGTSNLSVVFSILNDGASNNVYVMIKASSTLSIKPRIRTGSWMKCYINLQNGSAQQPVYTY